MSSIITITVLLASLLFSTALWPAMEKTYFNPVLVDTYSIRRLTPAPYTGTLGIGDPAVIFHEGKYYLYATGDNLSYRVYISGDLVHWTKGPKTDHARMRLGDEGCVDHRGAMDTQT